jgi:hypothetical protein
VLMKVNLVYSKDHIKIRTHILDKKQLLDIVVHIVTKYIRCLNENHVLAVSSFKFWINLSCGLKILAFSKTHFISVPRASIVCV